MFQKVLFIGLVCMSSQLYAENYNFKPGLWETTTTSEIVEINASPEIKKMMEKVPKISQDKETECINSISSLFDEEPDDAEECKTKKNRVNSNKMVFEMLCTGEDSTSKGTGEINLKGKTFTLSMINSLINEPMKMKIKVKIVAKGKYIGACK